MLGASIKIKRRLGKAMGNYIGLAGIAVILGIAVLFSSNRKAINLRIVGAAFGLQVVIAAFVLTSTPAGPRLIL